MHLNPVYLPRMQQLLFASLCLCMCYMYSAHMHTFVSAHSCFQQHLLTLASCTKPALPRQPLALWCHSQITSRLRPCFWSGSLLIRPCQQRQTQAPWKTTSFCIWSFDKKDEKTPSTEAQLCEVHWIATGGTVISHTYRIIMSYR